MRKKESDKDSDDEDMGIAGSIVDGDDRNAVEEEEERLHTVTFKCIK